MGNDSHRKRCQSEAPRHSQFSSRSNGESPSVSYSGSPYTPSRLSQVTNAGDISDVDAQTEALGNLSFSSSGQQQAVPVTIDTVSAWVKQGGSLEALDDGTMEMLLSQYIGRPKGERSRRCRYQAAAPKVIPPPAPILEEEEQVQGGALDKPPSLPSRRKDKGKDRAR
ncbi:hypothetical protein BBO_01191 [Beauveria brongniartii RCEF 3172]|uniref:Uncharacterized protein n=1 Tax=Beauveria brongniartii RCEF 3172 TaxID=1081107 RepID=A0A167K5H8_9HYPO|nr:hypothetical protein BBO_01191 [Beauveria brongniartii RCEF 3172]